jgi:hypothetical protein
MIGEKNTAGMLLSLLHGDDAVLTAVNSWQKPVANVSNVWLKGRGGLMNTAGFPHFGKLGRRMCSSVQGAECVDKYPMEGLAVAWPKISYSHKTLS